MDHKPKQNYEGAQPPPPFPWQRDKNWMVYIREGIFFYPPETHLLPFSSIW